MDTDNKGEKRRNKLERFTHVTKLMNIHTRKNRHSDYSQTLLEATLWNV